MRSCPLLAATCSSPPAPPRRSRRRPAPVTPAAGAPPERGALIGADAGELASRFGAPRLQVREGDGTKLQFAGGGCVLDAYLYPPPADGAPRVTHVDTRTAARAATSSVEASCTRLDRAR